MFFFKIQHPLFGFFRKDHFQFFLAEVVFCFEYEGTPTKLFPYHIGHGSVQCVLVAGQRVTPWRRLAVARPGNVRLHVLHDHLPDLVLVLLQTGHTFAERMPTREEYNELLDGCDWKISNEGAVRCVIGVSKKNGQEILFPCTGYRTDMNIENILPKDKSNGENNESVAEGYYWSSSLDEFQFFGTYVRISCSEISGIHRDNGFLVRPVASK